MACAGEQHPGVADATGFRHQSRPRKDTRAELRGREKYTILQKRLSNAGRWAEKARLSSLWAQETSERRWKVAKEQSREAYADLNRELADLEAQGASEREYRARRKHLVAAVEAEMEGSWRGYYRSHHTCNREYAKRERYCRQQREIFRELEDLKAGERQMYQLDDRKDQVMTAMKLAHANLAMWVREHYCPPAYVRASWRCLVPFFRLPGRVQWGEDSVRLALDAFNDRALYRDLTMVCSRLADSPPRPPGGRRFLITVNGVGPHSPGAQHSRAA